MLQLDTLGVRGSTVYDNAAASANPNNSRNPSITQTSGQNGRSAPGHQQGASSSSSGSEAWAMVHWKTFPQQQQPQPTGAMTSHSEGEDNDYPPITPPPPRERLSYTRHQLEMLNGIYQEMRYPNGTQKQLIAKRVGITREQVKIWFQNRRRKDVVTKTCGNKSPSKDGINSTSTEFISSSSQVSGEVSNYTDEIRKEANGSREESQLKYNSSSLLMTHPTNTSVANNADSNFEFSVGTDRGKSCGVNSDVSGENACRQASISIPHPAASSSSTHFVSPTILRGMIAELQRFGSDYIKFTKSKKKKRKLKKVRSTTSSCTSSSQLPSSVSCKYKRLFLNYDMVAPPNKVTPTAFLNTSVNKFKHAGGTSAFQNPRENRTSTAANESRLWEGFGVNVTVPTNMDTPDFMQQRLSSDFVHSPLSSTLNLAASSHQSQFNSFLSGRDGIPASHSFLSSPQPPLFENLPVLSDLLGSYRSHPPSATAIVAAAAATAAVAAAQRQPEQPYLSSTASGQTHSGANIPSIYFPLSAGTSSSSSSSTGDSSKSLGSDQRFQHPATFPLNHHSQASSLTTNRIYFPLVVEAPVMLSNSRQQPETFHTHPPWHHPAPSATSQAPTEASALVAHGSSNTVPARLSEGRYRPQMISSFTNEYISPASSTYSLTSSNLPAQSHFWSMQPATESDANNSSFTEL